jgi:hypothetical protein
MDETHDKSPKKPISFPWVASPNGIEDTYANSIHLTWTIDDVRLRLAQVIADAANPNPGPEFRGVNEERGAVTLSWRMAKLLRDQLSLAISRYEETNGEIKTDTKLPPGTP